ncbi:hypothetical protein KCH_07830 [Kitasatospora cheerisanensis KCTC 2395]|uniref:Uncharacterized protein n=1 Tax=Kitasatospora cheerisanensis KCTC 2395 TaxID=1348663 RepID=A0A066ZAR9_9ACTN|nr:hypothetical protein KCH_07830 [Kitasatospora cheerisanensis KCTC 2395]
MHPDQNLARYTLRIQAAGWHLAEQSFGVDGSYRCCEMRFVRPAE